MVGFMGCYAAINALKLARHIVRSDPKAGVLMVNLELCTLHFQETQELEQMLSFLVFADGAAASLITACEQGFALDSFKAVTVPETRGLITWKIRGLGFDMFLSGQIPAELGRALREGELMAERDGIDGVGMLLPDVGQRGCLRRLEFRAVPGDRQLVDGDLFGLAVDREFETVGQQCPQH